MRIRLTSLPRLGNAWRRRAAGVRLAVPIRRGNSLLPRFRSWSHCGLRFSRWRRRMRMRNSRLRRQANLTSWRIHSSLFLPARRPRALRSRSRRTLAPYPRRRGLRQRRSRARRQGRRIRSWVSPFRCRWWTRRPPRASRLLHRGAGARHCHQRKLEDHPRSRSAQPRRSLKQRPSLVLLLSAHSSPSEAVMRQPQLGQNHPNKLRDANRRVLRSCRRASA